MHLLLLCEVERGVGREERGEREREREREKRREKREEKERQEMQNECSSSTAAHQMAEVFGLLRLTDGSGGVGRLGSLAILVNEIKASAGVE